MRSLLLTLVGLLPLLAVGCAGQISEMPTWVGFDEDNVEAGNHVAVVVLKVEPPAQVLLAAGRIDQNGWRSTGRKGEVWLSARDGFVVAKVTPTQDEMAYAVIQVKPDQLAGGSAASTPTYETGFWPRVTTNAVTGGSTQGEERAGDRLAYGPAGEGRVPVLKAIAGRVVFVGAIRIDALQEHGTDKAPPKIGITPVASPDDGEAVRRFLAEKYPKVRARIVPRPLQMMRRTEAGQ